MFTFNQVLILLAVVFGISICAGMFCAWLVFKAKNAVPGERLIGGVPKGTVFTIPDASEELDNGLVVANDKEAEKSVLERTEEFLKAFGGDKL